MDRPLLVGIAGGSGSGKTYLAKRIVQELIPGRASRLSMDQYFRSTEEYGNLKTRDINFDHPSRIDWSTLLKDLESLKMGKCILAPSYDFRLQRQFPEAIRVEPTPVVIAEGLFILAHPIVDVFDITIFLDVDKDQRLIGRILRDIEERDADVQWTIDRYQRFVRPSYETFVEPTRQNADIVVDFTYRRVMFQAFLVVLLRSFIAGDLDMRSLLTKVQAESYSPGVSHGRSYSAVTIDLRTIPPEPPHSAADHPKLIATDTAIDPPAPSGQHEGS